MPTRIAIDLLKSLIKAAKPKELSKILPYTSTQIEKLTAPLVLDGKPKKDAKCFLNPIVFFVTDEEKKIIEEAISKLAEQVKGEKTEAAKWTAALMILIEYFLKVKPIKK